MSTKSTLPSKDRGFGDTLARIFTRTGIKKVVEAVAGENCGCEERQEKLNKIFPYEISTTTDTADVLHEEECSVRDEG